MCNLNGWFSLGFTYSDRSLSIWLQKETVFFSFQIQIWIFLRKYWCFQEIIFSLQCLLCLEKTDQCCFANIPNGLPLNPDSSSHSLKPSLTYLSLYILAYGTKELKLFGNIQWAMCTLQLYASTHFYWLRVARQNHWSIWLINDVLQWTQHRSQ